MYKNVGKKIKGWVDAITFIGIAISMMVAFALFATASEAYNRGLFIFLGIVILIVGSLLVWLSGLLLYGFGELVDKVTQIEKHVRPLKTESSKEDASVSPSAPKDNLKKLKLMLAAGLISEEDYEKLKKEVT